MRFRLLGSLGVETETGITVDLGPPKQRSVLAVLLLNANEVVPTDRIIDMVWGDSPPRTAEHSVQIYISDLRKTLSNGSSTELIETRPPGYVINIAPDAVDTLRFERLVRDGLAALRTGDVPGGRPKLERALETWNASPLADFAYEEFAQGYIRSLTELHSDALEALAGVDLEQGRLEDVRDLVREAIEADPLREEPRRLMILALYRSGRQADGLREYGDYQKLLAEELGIEPSENLRLLEERVLLQDPTLDLQTRVSAEGNPYRGLRSFSEDDADIYFGRESLVAEVRQKLVTGVGFVSIVGPSGSGKSSAAQAGLIPTLRAEGETVVVFQPGSRPLWELAGALDRAGFGSRSGLLRRFENDPSALLAVIDRSVVLIVDQFEELFTLAEPDVAIRFSELMATAIRDPETSLRIVATLRADYYDKPLSMPALAGVFSDSVVSVKPMTGQEIERAVIEPASAAGVSVEPALLAQLVADMGDEPGALPLLQFTLFELFDRTSNGLTLSDYQGLGGLNGALTGGADAVLEEFDAESKDIAEQLMMRMIQKGRALRTSRPVPLRDLLELGVDRIALQGVLEAFGARRLITFDRDASGAAVVEMAHEYLITEWPQLESWIFEHSDDLDRLYALDTAAGEWMAADKSEDYLLRGERLDQFEAWAASTSLMLTTTETRFIDASVEMRRRDETIRLEQAANEQALAGQARRRLWYFGGAVAALAAAVTLLIVTLVPEPAPDMVIWFEGRGDGSFGDLIGNGIDLAVAEYGIEPREFQGQAPFLDEIERLVERGTPLAFFMANIVFSPRGPEIWTMIAENPGTQFVIIDCGAETADFPIQMANFDMDWPANASCITSANDQIGYLAGVAAAALTDSGRVGFVGGVEAPFIFEFQAGFEEGVAFIDPDYRIDQIYLTSWPDFSGFNSTSMGYAATGYLASQGDDVIFHAAGGSGWGMFRWLSEETAGSRTMWGIGVDVDQSVELERNQFVFGLSDAEIAATQSIMLTSIRKRLDLGILAAVTQFQKTGSVAHITLDFSNNGVDYTDTGGHIDPYRDVLDAAILAVVEGEVVIRRDYADAKLLLDFVPGS